MKKCFSCLFTVLFAVVMIAGCGKGKNEAPVFSAENSASKDEGTLGGSQKYWCASNLYSGTGVFVADDANDGNLRWVGSMPKGMEFYAAVDGDDVIKFPMHFVNEKKGAKASDMAMIKFNETDTDVYYVLEANIETGFSLVVVGDDITGDAPYTFVYNSDDISKVTSKKIPAGTLVVAKNSFTPSEDFCLVTFYVAEGPAKGFYREKYLETRALEDSKKYLMAAMVADRFDHTKELKPEVEAEAANNYRAALDTILEDPESRSDDEFGRFIGILNLLDR